MSIRILLDWLAYIVGIAAVIGIIRYKKIIKSYRPFVYFLCLGFVTEIISDLLIRVFQKDNSLLLNVYVWPESLLILWQFRNWAAIARGNSKDNNYKILAIVLSAFWLIDNLFVHNLHSKLNPLYRIIYGFVTVYLSIDQINKLILQERTKLLTDARFLICAAFVFYYAYKATLEVFFAINLPLSLEFYKQIFDIVIYVNLFANLLFVLATTWIPTRQKFSLPY
ncbi:hypothetical protein [Foetidibacter luteolus]|uniref:hypothetical protein n=1 Tax=Foetidibacter luteolus TaxID=2608880 RepID=UPI00129BBE7C|nr:hypothetical protein [Foetidibacter luteolus]